MADRRAQDKTSTRSGGGVGAPGTTGAFQTSDPLGAPGSTGAGLTHHDPTAIPGVGGAVYEDPSFVDYTGTGHQQQQHRHPTSDVGFGGTGHQQQQQHHHLNPTAGVGYGGTDPTSGVDFGTGKGQQHQQIRDPTSGVTGYGDRSDQQQQHLRDPTSGIGFGDKGELERGQEGVTGFTRVTAAKEPSSGGGVMYGRETAATAPGGGVVYGRETATTRAEELGAGKDQEKKGMAEKAKEIKDKIKGAACGHHEP